MQEHLHHIQRHRSECDGSKIAEYLDALNNNAYEPEFHYIKGILDVIGVQKPITKPLRLASIFSFVELQKKVDKTVYYTPNKLEMRHLIPNKDHATMPFHEVQEHITGFATDLQSVWSMDNATFDTLITQLQRVIDHYAWSLPAGENELQYVSLSEHSKLLAALVAAHQRQESADTHTVTMVVGDLSGIQKYIFDISHTGAGSVAKRLRARSFQIGILSDLVAHRILHTFEMPLFNMIISSGGKFYLLLPGHAHEQIFAIQKELDEWALENFHGEIAINLGTSSFSIRQFADVSVIFESLSTALQNRKSTPLQLGLTQQQAWDISKFVFTETTQNKCKSCNKFPVHKSNMCKACFADREIGEELAKARYIVYRRGDTPSSKLADSVYRWGGYFVEATKSLPSYTDNIYLIYQLNEYSSQPNNLPLMTRYVSNYVPTASEQGCAHCLTERPDDPVKANNVLLFECIADAADGESQLAYLKADVDNLGSLFAFGMRKDRMPTHFSHVTTLSKMLDVFFSGWLHQTLKTKYPSVYTVFSGGDDMFLIGPWDQAMSLATHMREALKDLAGENPNITISAGVVLSKPTMPIYRQAEQSENELEMAKEVPSSDRKEGRDQIAILGISNTWEGFSVITREAKQLGEWWQANKISSSFLYRLIEYSEMYKDYLKGKTIGLKFLPLLTYDIARNFNKNTPREIITWIERFLNTSKENPLVHIGVIVKLARLYKGTNKREKEA